MTKTTTRPIDLGRLQENLTNARRAHKGAKTAFDRASAAYATAKASLASATEELSRASQTVLGSE